MSADRNVGLSTFERARYAVLYLEAAAEIPAPKRIAESEGVKATIKELTMQAAGGRTYHKKQAPQHIVKLLEVLEKVVVDEGLEKYTRAHAWLKLVTFWSVLRGEDSSWLVWY